MEYELAMTSNYVASEGDPAPPLRRIAEAGFTNIRLPVRWNAHALEEPPYTIDDAFMERVDEVVEAALEQGLRVVMNIHHYGELMSDPPAHRERFLALWKQIAEHFADAPDELWLELLNEPSGQLDAVTWNEFLNAAIPAVRDHVKAWHPRTQAWHQQCTRAGYPSVGIMPDCYPRRKMMLTRMNSGTRTATL